MGEVSSAIQIHVRTLSLNLYRHGLYTVVLNMKSPPPHRERCPPNRFTTKFQPDFPSVKYGISSIKLNFLSTIPFLLGPWNDHEEIISRGKLVGKPRCGQFPFWLQPDFHLLNITWSSSSGVSKESSVAEEEESPQSSPRCLLQSYQAINLNVITVCLICTFQTDLVTFFSFLSARMKCFGILKQFRIIFSLQQFN